MCLETRWDHEIQRCSCIELMFGSCTMFRFWGNLSKKAVEKSRFSNAVWLFLTYLKWGLQYFTQDIALNLLWAEVLQSISSFHKNISVFPLMKAYENGAARLITAKAMVPGKMLKHTKVRATNSFILPAPCSASVTHIAFLYSFSFSIRVAFFLSFSKHQRSALKHTTLQHWNQSMDSKESYVIPF